VYFTVALLQLNVRDLFMSVSGSLLLQFLSVVFL